MQRPPLLPTLCLPLLLVALPLQAGRPFITEDAGVLARGDCEWESVAARARVSGEPRASGLSTQLGCGLGAQLQLAANAGRARAGGERASSLGLAGKWGLWEGGDGALTLAWGSSWSRLRGAGSDWDGAGALLAYSRQLGGGWGLHANLGHAYSRAERRSETPWALLVERQLHADVDVGTELFGADGRRPGLGLGARWRPAEGWTVDASLARSGSQPRERLVTVGLKLEF